jgi:hypothetical protein
MGGNPDAIAMPKHSGRAIKNTKKPESRSLRQFSISPGSPDFGTMLEDELGMGFLKKLRKTLVQREACHVESYPLSPSKSALTGASPDNSVSTGRLKRQIQPNRWLICTAIALSKAGFGARKPEITALARAMHNIR